MRKRRNVLRLKRYYFLSSPYTPSSPFSSTPLHFISLALPSSPKTTQDANAPKEHIVKKSVTEEKRLAHVIECIDFDTATVPRGALTLDASHAVLSNSIFDGKRRRGEERGRERGREGER